MRSVWTRSFVRVMRAAVVGALAGVVAAATASALPTAVAGSGPANAGPAATEPVELDLAPYVGRLKTLTVTVGEREVPFLFDTAGGATLIAPELADALGWDRFGRVVGFRMSGERVEFQRCGTRVFGIGPFTVEAETEVFDLNALLPDDFPELGGVLSLHTFQDRAITLDLAASRLTIETAESLERRIRTMRPLTVRLSRQMGGAGLDVFVAADAAGGPLWLELDSGNLDRLLLAPHALGQLGLIAEEGAVALRLPGLDSIETDYASRDLIYDGALNAATLERLIVTLDLPTERAWAALRD